MSDNFKIVENIFLESEQIPENEFDSWLRRRCGGDEAIMAEVRSLRSSASEVDGFLESSVARFAAGLVTEDEASGKQFGNYTILEQIGAGGMGAVYLAERSDGEYTQRCAIKVVRQTIAERDLVRQFMRERQILASLNHSNIAKLLDGGLSASGEPYLVMEYVAGEPLLDHLERAATGLRDRLKLFLKICRAVAYAHRNLVIHRDIKPSNILVDKEGEPKLLDFGLAKALDQTLGGDEKTQTMLRALTPAYASPEQLRGENVTTASDIYSLGVLLCEMLTGSRPYRLKNYTFEEVLRAISTDDPQRPSTLDNHGRMATADRASARFATRLKGDLDNIILTALQKEPERRYHTIEDFAQDIEKFLDGKPVSARPQTLRYRAAKLIIRNRLTFAAACLVLLVLSAGVGLTIWQAGLARQEKRRTEAVNEFLSRMLNYSSPDTAIRKADGQQITIKDVLDKAAGQLNDGRFSQDPEVLIQLEAIIAHSYAAQGFSAEAERYVRRAIDLQSTVDPSAPSMTLLKADLADFLSSLGRIEEANAACDETIPKLREMVRMRELPGERLAVTLGIKADLVRAGGDSAQAESILREAIQLEPYVSAGGMESIYLARGTLALTMVDQGKLDEAIVLARETVEKMRAARRADTPEFGYALTTLGSYLGEKGEWVESERALVEGETIYRRLLGSSHLWLGDNLRIQAYTLCLQDRLDESEAKISETLAIYQAGTSEDYVNFPTAVMIKGMILDRRGRFVEAEPLLRKAFEIRLRNLSREHFLTSMAESALGECLAGLGYKAEAKKLLEESYENLRRSQGDGNPRTLLARARLENFRALRSNIAVR